MKYLKHHRIYERFGRQMLALLNKLKETFKDTEYAIELDDDYIIVGVKGRRDKIDINKIYYRWDMDDFTEDEIKSTIEERKLVVEEPEDEHDTISIEIGDIILSALGNNTTVSKPSEWWEPYVDTDVSDSKLYDMIETNLAAHPNWIMKPQQVEGFFQDVIDDIDSEKYSWEFEIGMIFQNKITWAYKLNFNSELNLDRNNYAKSLADFNTLLSSVYRACKRIEQEENIHTFVEVTGKIGDTQRIQARIYNKREIIHGEILDIEQSDERENQYETGGEEEPI